MLELHIERKGYSGNLLYQDLQMKLQRGELLCLMGPSGCGKTSLLNIIAGLDQEYEGSFDLSPNDTISYMFQEPRLLPWLKVQQNLELVVNGSSHPWSTDQRRRKCAAIPKLLTQLGLQHCTNMYPSQLSLGMARRIALVRCLIVEPQLILMDEPFASLDQDNREAIYRQLDHMRQQHPDLTVILVTHDINEAMQLADRILLLQQPPNCQFQQFVPSRTDPDPRCENQTLYRQLQMGIGEKPSICT
ncbi:MAG: ATP-binding cassette domain-containing protein [Motiliproteus sp.]|nr:ATP-binding cassette domain-containing protein [Motiliproteus sp.]